MKKTQRKDALRNIKKRIASFLSICIVIALGFGVLFTTRYTGAGLDREYSKYFRNHNFKDYEVVSSLGVSDKNIDRIMQVPGITNAEGALVINGIVTHEKKSKSAVICSVTDEVSVPEAIEGRLPEGRSECMVAEDMAETAGIKVGDVVKIKLQGSKAFSNRQPLYETEFTVTGLMLDPEQFSRKSVSRVRVPLEAFNEDVTNGLYTEVFVKAEEPEGVSMFSDKYFEETAETKKALEELVPELSADRTASFKDESNAKIDEKENEFQEKIDTTQGKIDEVSNRFYGKLSNYKNKLISATNRINNKFAELEKKLKEAKKKIAKAEKKLKESKAKLANAKQHLKELKDKYKGKDKDIEEALKKLALARKTLEELKKHEGMSEEVNKDLKELADFVLNNKQTIRDINDFFKDPEVIAIAEKIKEEQGVDITEEVYILGEGLDVDELFRLAQLIKDHDDFSDILEELEEFINKMEKLVQKAQDALDKLCAENLARDSFLVGNIMYDSFLYFADKPWAAHPLTGLDGEPVEIPEQFYYMTCHRQENTYDDTPLTEILLAMNSLDAPTIYPVHPRNKERASRICRAYGFDNLRLVQPVGYADSVHLTRNAKKIVTDSGGLQCEAFYAGVQCVFVFDRVVWPETMVANRNQLAAANHADILEKLSAEQFIDPQYQPFGDGHAAEKICARIREYEKRA